MTLILMVVFFLGIVIGLPVALVMGTSTFAALYYGTLLPLEVFPQTLFNGVNSFPMLTIPFFLLAADLMTGGKLTDMLIKFSHDLVGHIRGGHGHVNIVVSVLFAGISGSALADAAGPGAIEMKMMRKAGYNKYYAGALTAATAVVGPIIPPSIMMIIYVLAEGKTTVTGLFLAGVIPGLLLGVSLMIANHIFAIKHGYSAESKRVPILKLFKSFMKTLPATMMPVIILGGILGGIFTPTEAGAVAVAYGLVVGIFVTKGLKVRDIPGIVIKSSVVTSAVLLVIAMGSAFSWALTYAQVPQQVAEWMGGLTDSRLLVLFLIAIFAIIAGMFLDTIPAVIILAPILSPVATQYGAEPLQVAMIIVLCLAVGMLTPPAAPLLFIISTVGRLKFERLAMAVMPLILVELTIIVLIILVPEISVGLPKFFGYDQ
jgi:tripartite ATP-independent transporter DctM subunit